MKFLSLAIMAAVAAFFMVLPQTGGDAVIEFGARGPYPATLHVARGARIQFRNDTRVTHTATCQGCGWSTRDVQPGQSAFITFRDDRAYAYSCSYHRGETGTLAVGDAEVPQPVASDLPAPAPST